MVEMEKEKGLSEVEEVGHEGELRRKGTVGKSDEILRIGNVSIGGVGEGVGSEIGKLLGEVGGAGNGGGAEIGVAGMRDLFDRSGQFLDGKASGDIDRQGVEGCLSVNASENVGDIGELKDGVAEDRSGVDAQGSKGKRGRPKGSKNKPKPIAEAGAVEIGAVRDVIGEDRSAVGAQGSKGKRGRPKGSNNKQKPIAEDGDVNVGGEERMTPKRKLGQPKGSKNKKKALANDKNGCKESKVLLGNESVAGKRKVDRPDGAKTKRNRKEDSGILMEASMSINVENDRCHVKKRGQPRKKDQAVTEDGEAKFEGEQAVGLSSKTSLGNDVHENDFHRKLLEIQEKFREMVVSDDVPVMSLKNERPVHADEEEKGMSAACGSNEGRNEVVQEKPDQGEMKRQMDFVGKNQSEEGNDVRKNGCRGKSSKSILSRPKKRRRTINPEALDKVTILVHQNYLVEDLSFPKTQVKIFEDTEKTSKKRPRGRPRKINNQSMNHSEFRSEQIMNSEYTEKKLQNRPRGKRPRGRPRLSHNLEMNHNEFRLEKLKNSEYIEKKLQNMPRGKRPRGRPRLSQNLNVNHIDFRARKLKNSKHIEQKMVKRLRGRPKKVNNIQVHPWDIKQGTSADPLERKESVCCHQCLRNDRNGVVDCLKCRKKHYCYDCLAKW